MSLDYRTLANLRDLLARLYYRDRDIERIVTTVGLQPAYIAWDDRPVNTWQSVLTEADHHARVPAVIDLARRENPEVQSLQLAAQDALLAIRTPEMPDSAWHGPTDEAGLEKITGAASTLRPIGFLLRGYQVSRPVGRVVLADRSSGSGFLIADNLLVTNHHVLGTPEVAAVAHVEFNYQKSPEGRDEPIDRYDLAPDQVFATSPTDDEGGDDWTVVKVKGDPVSRWGSLPLAALPDAAPRKGDEVIIIQHPGGGPKQIALSHNLVAYADRAPRAVHDRHAGGVVGIAGFRHGLAGGRAASQGRLAGRAGVQAGVHAQPGDPYQRGDRGTGSPGRALTYGPGMRRSIACRPSWPILGAM